MSAVRTFFLLYGRNMRQVPRIPVVLVFGIVMPLIQLTLFGSIFQNLSDTQPFRENYPSVNYYSYIAPALILFTIFIGMVNASAAFIVDLRTGYFDKLRTTPARPGLVMGARLLAESTRVALQGLLVLTIAMLPAFGAHVILGLPGMLVLILLATFFSLCTAGLAVTALAMKTKSDQATQSAFPLFFVLLFLSEAFQAKGGMPEWVQGVIAWNPVNYLVKALRQIMVGVREGTGMVAEWPVADIFLILGVSVVLGVLLTLLNYRVYRKMVG